MHSKTIASELNLAPQHVRAAIALLDDGNTVPFLARYRKEATGSLDEEQLRQIQVRIGYLRQVSTRKEAILREIESQDKLTESLRRDIDGATSLQDLEDLYAPFRPRRHTRASIAQERGLTALADAIQEQDPKSDPPSLALAFVGPDVPDPESALAGARDIIAERVSLDPRVRQLVRSRLGREGTLVSEVNDPDADAGGRFRLYYDFKIALTALTPHQWLAIVRGEASGILRTRFEGPDADILLDVMALHLTAPANPASRQVETAIEDSYRRLILPAVSRDLRRQQSTIADDHAIGVFTTNLRHLLLQPPLRHKAVMGIDPGFRTGCKIATVDATGKLRSTATIYPHPPQKRAQEALHVLEQLIAQDRIDVIAIGNGTASRETEQLVAELNRDQRGAPYVIVNEAGASVYSASPLARSELPDLDVTLRGAVSIARRLQDPLAELVKIDPKSIGVGMYQHDVDQKGLTAALENVVESVVNQVGVDVNTASVALLTYVAGLTPSVARAIVEKREAVGPYHSRRELLAVKGLGPKGYEQCAGFLRIPDGSNRLDNTIIHPESYNTVADLMELADLNLRMADLASRLDQYIRTQGIENVAAVLEIGVPTLTDIVNALLQPGRDPRDDLPPPVLRQDVLTLSDLQVGMELQGTVRNVVDFGAFVDIGLKHDGLVHVSQMAARYVRNPHEYVAVGDIVTVKVIDIDEGRGRVGLSMAL